MSATRILIPLRPSQRFCFPQISILKKVKREVGFYNVVSARFPLPATRISSFRSLMSGGSNSTVFIGNLDEKVSERVLYDILIQAGRLVDLYIPRDKEKNKPKGFAFAEYETVEVADYAVKLFSGLVKLYNRTLRFAISGQDKPSPNTNATVTSTSNLSIKPRSDPVSNNHAETPPHASTPTGFSPYPGNYRQEPVYPDVINQPNGYRSHSNGNYNKYSQRDFRATVESMSYSRSRRYDTNTPVDYPSYEY